MTYRQFRLREEWFILCLALIALLLHLAIITHGNRLIFDEHHYVPEARSIIQERELLEPSHPSLGKLFITAGILFFGDNPWGWRIFPVVFGVVSIVLFYLICRQLAGKYVAFLASLLLLFENLTFLHSGLAILDVFSVTFMLLSFLLYLKGRYALSGVSLALSGVCKLTGLFGFLVIVPHWLLTERKRETRSMAFFLVSAVAAFFLLMTLADFIATGEWLNPFHRVCAMSLESAGTATGQFTPEQLRGMRYPWEWILNPIGVAYDPRHLRYIGMITPTIWALTIPSLGYMMYEFVKNRRNLCLFGLLWFSGTYLIWIPFQLVTGRVTYLFYFLPTVGAICLAIGFAIWKGWQASTVTKDRPLGCLLQTLIVAYLLLHIVLFLVFSPLLAAFYQLFSGSPQ